MNNWFEIDSDGWKRMNAGRPPAELVKELIQNVLDEDFNTVNIDYSYDKKNEHFVLCIEDDIACGIKNSSLISTVFMTGKEDSPLKRGRKGRGLKEFLSVCKNATVETVGKTVEFCDNGTRKEYDNNRTIGTKISCIIKENKWNREAVGNINTFLNKIIIYGNGKVFINGKELEKKEFSYKYNGAFLSTQIIEDGKQVERFEKTDILIYHKKDKDGWLYEMGIPVVKTDIPYDIDIQQRIVLNDNRNEVGVNYLNKVKKYIVKSLLHVLTKKDILGWASEGFQESWDFNIEECKTIAHKITELKNIDKLVIKSSNKNSNDKAKQKGFNIFDVSSMDYRFKNIFSFVAKDAIEVIKNIENNTQPIIVEPTVDELKFIEVHKKLAKVAIGKNININIIEKSIDTISGKYTLASYEVGSSTLSYNRLAISRKTFENPYSTNALDILFHELGHENSSEHDFVFIDAVTKYSARITVYLMKDIEKEKVEKKSSIKDDIKAVLLNNDYLSLREIYEKLNITTTNEKAGIRSVLNKECANNGIFERYYAGGMYRLKVI